MCLDQMSTSLMYFNNEKTSRNHANHVKMRKACFLYPTYNFLRVNVKKKQSNSEEKGNPSILKCFFFFRNKPNHFRINSTKVMIATVKWNKLGFPNIGVNKPLLAPVCSDSGQIKVQKLTLVVATIPMAVQN